MCGWPLDDPNTGAWYVACRTQASAISFVTVAATAIMGKVDKKNKEKGGGKKRGWVSAMWSFEAEVNAVYGRYLFLSQFRRGQKATVQIHHQNPYTPDSLQETYRG